MAIGIKNPTTTQRGNSLGRVVAWPWGLLALWLVASAAFFGRAIAGRFPDALQSLGLIAFAISATLITLGLRILLRGSWLASVTAPYSVTGWLGQLLPTLGNVLLAVGFTVAGAYATGLVFLWIFVAAEVLFGAAGPWTLPRICGWFGLGLADRGTVIIDHPRGTIQRETVAVPAAPSVDLEKVDLDSVTETDEELPWLWQEAAALQELRYMTLPQTGLCVAGSQRATLPAAQQTAVVHTVFHPPFASAPVVTLEMQDPDSVAIKAAQILPHGVRWELRASQSSEQPREVQWAFSASGTRDPRG